MYIRNNKSTKTDPSETPEFAVVSGDNLLFKATLCYHFFKGSLKDIAA